MRRRSDLIVGCALLAALFGCGGGGGTSVARVSDVKVPSRSSSCWVKTYQREADLKANVAVNLRAITAETPTYGYFASPTGSATGAGTVSDPWTLQKAMDGGYPTNTVRPGDTVWLRGGTYTGQFLCKLDGSAGNYITFRGYPGERAVIDGNYDPAESGNGIDTVWLKYDVLDGHGSYLILRDVEVTNSQTNRYESPDYSHARGGVTISAPYSKVINCVVHDLGVGIASFDTGHHVEAYGNLVYHGGNYRLTNETDQEAAIDLTPAGGVAVALSGFSSHGAAGSGGTATWSHNHTGDYLVVAVQSNDNTGTHNFTDLSATYDGVSMTLINGNNGDLRVSQGVVALFGIIPASTGAHNVVISSTASTFIIRGIAQSFVNVHQATPATAAGGYSPAMYELCPFRNTVSSATNHMIVDAWFVYGNCLNERVSGDNALIDLYKGAGSQYIAMTYAPGAASVDMGWTMDQIIDQHGHCFYMNHNNPVTYGPVHQGFKTISDNIAFDPIGDFTYQFYGTSSGSFCDGHVVGNLAVGKGIVIGGGAGFLLTNTVMENNYTWGVTGVYVGNKSQDLRAFSFIDNYVHRGIKAPEKPEAWPELTMTGNTLIGTLDNFAQSNFPGNTYYSLGSPPTTNLVVVRPNVYEANRANIYVYNWEDLDDVEVDLSSAVAPGTPIYIMNAQDYYADPVYTGTYDGGMVSLPMDGLTVQAGIGWTAPAATGRAFNAFIVRAQSGERWRQPLMPEKPASPPPKVAWLGWDTPEGRVLTPFSAR